MSTNSSPSLLSQQAPDIIPPGSGATLARRRRHEGQTDEIGQIARKSPDNRSCSSDQSYSSHTEISSVSFVAHEGQTDEIGQIARHLRRPAVPFWGRRDSTDTVW